MKVLAIFVAICSLAGCCFFVSSPKETVLNPGESISVTNGNGTIVCSYVAPLKRRYDWDNTSRLISLEARDIRWYGALGIYSAGVWFSAFPKVGKVTRIVAQESALHFDSVNEFLKWQKGSWIDLVYNNEGYAGGWCISPGREQLNVDIWRIFINGKAPKGLPGANNSAVRVSKQNGNNNN
ncbi:MAG: hypothetical protein PHC88_13085 [Terrimicrobiaceae bacterium]|nr:hypothetical protein [Terrimicrobiaceae bacterium]